MYKRRDVLSVLWLVALGAGCAPGGTGPSGVTVSASISAATLAEDCGTSRAPSAGLAGDCAPASEDAGSESGSCGGSYCQQSNMQLSLDAGPGQGSVAVQVLTVRLLDATTGAVLDQLTAREPQVWNGSAYTSWNGEISAAQMLRTSYKLSAPNWPRIGESNSGSTYTRRYRIEAVIRIDGAERTVQSAELTREPEVVT